MGLVGYFEENFDRLQENIAGVQEALDSEDSSAEEKLRTARRVLWDAKHMLDEFAKHMDLATSPELDLAHEIAQQSQLIFEAKNELHVATWKLEASEREKHGLQDSFGQLRKIVEMFGQEDAPFGADATAPVLDNAARGALLAEIAVLLRAAATHRLDNALMRAKIAKLESPEYWHAEVKRYLSMPEIRRNRRDRRG